MQKIEILTIFKATEKEKNMKSLFSSSTSLIKTALQVKELRDTLVSPLSFIGGFVKTLIVGSVAAIAKQVIKYTLVDGKDPESNIFMRQLNALVDKDADLAGISKVVHFDITPDTLLEVAKVDTENTGFFQTIKNKYGETKNGMRSSIYDYMTENDYENIHTIKDAINSLANTPTDIVGLEFVNSTIDVVSNNPETKTCVLRCNLMFALKTNK